MLRRLNAKSDQRGATLVEFAIGATVFLMVMFGVIEFGRLLWTHNALTDAARRATRYAVNKPANSQAGEPTTGNDIGPSLDDIRNVGVYGDPNPGGSAQPLVNNLTPENLHVHYEAFRVGGGTVSVTVTEYQFQFLVPIFGASITMPDYNTTLTGESAGTGE